MHRNRYIRYLLLVILCAFLLATASCTSVHPVPQDRQATLANEGTIVFVRPDTHRIPGYRSLSDYIEIVYEQTEINRADLLVVRVGIRNRGGTHFWDLQGKAFSISAKTLFYDQPLKNGQRNAPLYETNWRTIKLMRGALTDFKVVCPVKGARYYQVLLSETVGR